MVGLSSLGGIVDGPIGRSLPAVFVVTELRVILLPHLSNWASPSCYEIGLSDHLALCAQPIIQIIVVAFADELMLRSILEDLLVIKGLHLIV